jgi:hypothetical protein
MTKITTQTAYGNNVEFKANVKSYTPPLVIDTFMDDDGNENYLLANGNTSLADRYNALWNPKKGVVNNDKKYKGENNNKRNLAIYSK